MIQSRWHSSFLLYWATLFCLISYQISEGVKKYDRWMSLKRNPVVLGKKFVPRLRLLVVVFTYTMLFETLPQCYLTKYTRQRNGKRMHNTMEINSMPINTYIQFVRSNKWLFDEVFHVTVMKVRPQQCLGTGHLFLCFLFAGWLLSLPSQHVAR